jgi:hypothetical protein
LAFGALTNAPQAYGVLLKTGDQKKATRRWHFLEAEKITSSLQQEQRQVQQQVLQQEQRQQVQQQGLRQQELGLLVCHKRLKRRPTTLPRGVIFSWEYFL